MRTHDRRRIAAAYAVFNNDIRYRICIVGERIGSCRRSLAVEASLCGFAAPNYNLRRRAADTNGGVIAVRTKKSDVGHVYASYINTVNSPLARAEL